MAFFVFMALGADDNTFQMQKIKQVEVNKTVKISKSINGNWVEEKKDKPSRCRNCGIS